MNREATRSFGPRLPQGGEPQPKTTSWYTTFGHVGTTPISRPISRHPCVASVAEIAALLLGVRILGIFRDWAGVIRARPTAVARRGHRS